MKVPSQMIRTGFTDRNLPVISAEPGKFSRWGKYCQTPRGPFIAPDFIDMAMGICKNMGVGTIYGHKIVRVGDDAVAESA